MVCMMKVRFEEKDWRWKGAEMGEVISMFTDQSRILHPFECLDKWMPWSPRPLGGRSGNSKGVQIASAGSSGLSVASQDRA